MKCRSLRETVISSQKQEDTVYSQSSENQERNQNKQADCKTDFGANENPGALAGATGANEVGKTICAEDYRVRTNRARALRYMIADCDPIDAALIMSDTLEQMRLGAPVPPLLNAKEEADEWATTATPFERKAWLLACFNACTPKEQAGFLDYVSRRAKA